jgi:hypothetical protein
MATCRGQLKAGSLGTESGVCAIPANPISRLLNLMSSRRIIGFTETTIPLLLNVGSPNRSSLVNHTIHPS